MADMSSRRAASAVQIAAGGEPVYVVRSGAVYRDINARDVGNGLFVIREPVRDGGAARTRKRQVADVHMQVSSCRYQYQRRPDAGCQGRAKSARNSARRGLPCDTGGTLV